MAKEETVESIINTMSEKQKKTLYYFVGCAIKGRHGEDLKQYRVLNTMNERQKKVLYYLIDCAHKEYNLEIVKEE